MEEIAPDLVDAINDAGEVSQQVDSHLPWTTPIADDKTLVSKGPYSPIRPAGHMGYALRQVSGRTGGAGEAGF